MKKKSITSTQITTFSEDQSFLKNIKEWIAASSMKAPPFANRVLMDIGKSIIEKQKSVNWDSALVDQLVKDLEREKTGKGFSRLNLFTMRKISLLR